MALVVVENDKRIILPPSDRSSSPNEAIAGGTITPSASSDALDLEKSISIKGSPISPRGLTRLRPFSSASLSTSPSMPDDGLLGAEDSSQPPVTGTSTRTSTSTKQLQLLSHEPLGDASSIIYPKQLKSSDLGASARTMTTATATSTTTAVTVAVAASSTMTMNCSRNDNDTENGINVNITSASAASSPKFNSISGGVASENDGCITTTITDRNRTTPINFSSRMPSKLIDSHDGDADDDDDDVPPTTIPGGDDVTFNRRGVDATTPPTTNSNANQSNFITEHCRGKGELASPRCQSRDSTGSTGGGRCQSDDSNCSGNGSNTAPTPSPNSPPVGLPLPATLPQSAAAALLPPQSAAMAAYLNAAAAAAQQNRLLLNNPLAGLQSAGQSPSPRLPTPDDSPALDFSTKRSRRDSDDADSDAMNLSNKSDGGAETPPPTTDVNCPLDLSVSSRKRSTDDDEPQIPKKMSRPNNDYKNIPTAWVPPINPYLAAVAAAGMSPKGVLPMDWNGKNKMVTNDATKALEKMSEMTRLGCSDGMGDMRSPAQPIGNSGASTGRHSAWQSHWLNKGADAVKDVFKCVWCKLSFPTLATLTTHMKETQHCGVNVPPSQQQNHHDQHHRHPAVSSAGSSNVTNSPSSANSKSDLNLLIKETMPLPRKLVRGQDVWLGKGAEQTRQILKCMWCGQSFRSLAEMTNHMQQTQHYTNIISQEQIISWKSSDEKGGGGSSTPTTGGPAPVGPPNSMAGPAQSPQSVGPPSPANSTVSAVLTCKVCDQAFSSLKDLSNHMIKNAHYKEHIMRSITETGGRRRQTREKRKKSLPVRKLLELERAAGHQDFKTNDHFKAVSTKITCEKCGDKIETALFVDHIRQCVGGAIANASPRSIKNSIIPPDGCLTSPPTPGSRDGLKSTSPASTSSTHRHISPHLPSPTPKDLSEKTSSSPSVLNAIEQLIEKSFDTRSSRHGATSYNQNNSGTPLGASILKRLGIDETVDYTKPLIDAQTMGLLRSYQQHHQSQYGGRRERSGSESSSISERGSSRMESLTPERKPPLPPSPPRRTPDKILRSPNPEGDHKEFKVKTEPNDEDEQEEEPERHSKISVRKEFNMERPPPETGGELDLRKNRTPSSSAAPSPVPTSPSSSDRSSAGCGEKKLPGSSLTALSSMFDSLNSHAATSSANDMPSAAGKKSSSANPLAALQKLCEKTENPPATSTRLNSSTTNHHPNGGNLTGAGTPSGMVAFSWACNDAVITSDSVIKCAFCDTPFCSKGAYRHHLSKVHFVKDDASMEPLLQSTKPLMSGSSSSTSSSAASSAAPPSPKARSPASAPPPLPPPPPTAQSPAASAADESVQSKFLKYTELAKQLSSKYV